MSGTSATGNFPTSSDLSDPMSITRFRAMHPPERQAMLERLAVTLERNAAWASEEDDEALASALRTVATAILSAAADLATNDVMLAEEVAFRAINLITTFHIRHPQFPVGPALH
jgi:hypothetical protein